MKKILIVMGSDSDLPALEPCMETLRRFSVPFTVRVCSAHRTPQVAEELSRTAHERGYGCIIAAAGKAAHLAGVLAAGTTLPVIGIPIKSSTLDGLDSLLSTVQMPAGVPVATVAIGGAENAALLAVQMLALSDGALHAALLQHKKDMAEKVMKKDEKVSLAYNN